MNKSVTSNPPLFPLPFLARECTPSPPHAPPPRPMQAAMRVSGLELGGLIGSLIAGRASDWLINKSEGRGDNVGARVKV